MRGTMRSTMPDMVDTTMHGANCLGNFKDYHHDGKNVGKCIISLLIMFVLFYHGSLDQVRMPW